MHLHIHDYDAQRADTADHRPWRDLDIRSIGPVGTHSDKAFRGVSMLAGYIAEREPLRQQLPIIN